jgi:hypothetical protein
MGKPLAMQSNLCLRLSPIIEEAFKKGSRRDRGDGRE